VGVYGVGGVLGLDVFVGCDWFVLLGGVVLGWGCMWGVVLGGLCGLGDCEARHSSPSTGK